MSALKAAVFIFTAISAAVAFELYEATSPPPVGRWRQVWRDDFNSFDNNPRTNKKWSFDQGNDWANTEMGWGNNEYQYYTTNRKNIRAENGNLIIEVQVETNNKPRSKHGVEFDLTSARIKTSGKASWGANHRFIARAKLPSGRGTWPAFWMLPQPQYPGDPGASWPRGGEIDIMERWAKAPNMMSSATHCLGTDGKTKRSTVKQIHVNNGLWYFAQYHNYEVQHRRDRLDFFIDGRWIYGVTRAGCRAAGIGWPFEDRKFYLLLNLALIEYNFNFKQRKWEMINAIKHTAPVNRQLIVDYVVVEQLI
uniref:GH16 domain-containing protein n=1 Tax=Plectus sambesii TaxID=2011161 RepID=A0A914VMW9_9BILA